MPDSTRPEWLEKTPLNITFELSASSEYDGELQSIHLTRDEYMDLKLYLAGMRGHVERVVPVSVDEWNLIVQARDNLVKAVDGAVRRD